LSAGDCPKPNFGHELLVPLPKRYPITPTLKPLAEGAYVLSTGDKFDDLE